MRSLRAEAHAADRARLPLIARKKDEREDLRCRRPRNRQSSWRIPTERLTSEQPARGYGRSAAAPHPDVSHIGNIMRIVKEILSPDKMRKVVIFERDDGTFGFETYRFSEDPYETDWAPYGKWSICYTPDAQTAEREARGRIEWLQDENVTG